MGLFSADIAVRLEESIQNRPLKECTDMFAGTSIGGIIAIGLAAGIPAKDIYAEIGALGPDLFPWRPMWSGFLFSKHKRKPLEDALTKLLGARKMGDLDRVLLVPAVAPNGDVRVFRSSHSDDRDKDIKLVDVALASAAAPTFFPSHFIGAAEWLDGGLAANSPDMLAASEALNTLKWPVTDVRLLAIGTTLAPIKIGPKDKPRNWGAAGWIRNQRIINVMMRAQQNLARETAMRMVGDDHMQIIDADLSAEEAKKVGLDKATPVATTTLNKKAEEAFTEAAKVSVTEFFGESKAKPWTDGPTPKNAY